MALDATHRPLRIPTNFQNYAEEQNVHDLLGKMMEKVLISRPEGPVNIFYLTYILKNFNFYIFLMIEYGHRANFFQSYSKNLSPDCVQNSLMISKITIECLSNVSSFRFRHKGLKLT